MDRNYLKGREGYAMNILMVDCGHNLPKILAWLRAKSFCASILARFVHLIDVMCSEDHTDEPLCIA